jgi:hypothetical protein
VLGLALVARTLWVMVAVLVMIGRRVRVRGGGIPRVRPPDVTMNLFYKLAWLPHMTPSVTLLQGDVAVAVARAPSWCCAARMPLESRRRRPWTMAEAGHSQVSLCPYGCDRRAGCTCRTCTHQG